MKTSKAVLNQLLLALACASLATPVFANEQVGTEELFGTVAVQETKEEKGYHIVDSATGQALIQDPTTGQPYTLEKLLALGLYRADGRSDIFEPNTGRILPIDPETGAPYTIEKLEMLGVVNGRGGADLVDRVTAQVYTIDPDTGQPYTLEKLLELGKISAEDYQHYVTLRQASQEVKSTQETPVTTDSDQETDTVQVTQEYASTEVAQPVQEEKVTAKNSNQSATATKKVLPQTADMPSLLGFAGLGLIIMGGLGLKKKK